VADANAELLAFEDAANGLLSVMQLERLVRGCGQGRQLARR
jgi:hypothetical protein